MSKKKLIALFILLALLLPLPFFINNFIVKHQISLNKKVVNEELVVFEEINFSGKKPAIKIKSLLSGQPTALDLLKKTANIKIQGEKNTAFVLEINNVAPDQKKREYWAFFINNKLANIGAGGCLLKNGDRILWKIINY
ncbi:MAG: DUF4430 domain-containing protein [Microgenomates group bacterium]|nr:DUF4430 domain-containing protein [Microgenomates group bacterium]